MDSKRWQVGKSLAECTGYIFTHQVACDVDFLIHRNDEEPKTISAHRTVLMARSPVFHDLLVDNSYSPSIDISDVDYTAFKKLLRFVLPLN